MEPWIIFSIFTFLTVLLSVTFKYLVSNGKIKPNILSKIFYYDDESFIKSWKRTKEKGFLLFVIKNGIYYALFISIILGIPFFKDNYSRMYFYKNRLMLIVVFVIFVAFACLLSPIKWNIQQDKYTKLTEKDQTEKN